VSLWVQKSVRMLKNVKIQIFVFYKYSGKPPKE
jgi:hypothetical protein